MLSPGPTWYLGPYLRDFLLVLSRRDLYPVSLRASCKQETLELTSACNWESPFVRSCSGVAMVG